MRSGKSFTRFHIYTLFLLALIVPIATVQAAQSKQAAAKQENQADEAVQQATKRLSEADRVVDSAQHDLEKQVDSLRNQFENSQEWADAQSGVKRAQADREMAVKPLLDGLHEEPKYKAALEQKDRCAAEVDRLRAAKASPKEMTAAATKSAGASGELLRMEQVVVNGDVAAQAAIKKLAEALKRTNDLKSAFNESIKTKPEFTAARNALTEARMARDKVAEEVRQAKQREAQARAEQEKSKSKQNGGRANRIRVRVR